MFISFKKTDDGQLIVIDEDFEEIVYLTSLHAGSTWKYIIEVYEKRNLPVATNLIKAFLFWNRSKPLQSIKQLIDYCNDNVKEYLPYKEEIEKYLSLI